MKFQFNQPGNNKKTYIPLVAGAALLLSAVPAKAWCDAYHYYNLGTNAEVWIGMDIPCPDTGGIDWNQGRIYTYAEAYCDSTHYVQAGITTGNNYGFIFKEYYNGWVDTSGQGQYRSLGSLDSASRVGCHIFSQGNGYWQIQINGQYGHPSQWMYNGISTLFWADACQEAPGSSTDNGGNPVPGRGGGTNFVNAFYRSSSTSSWYYWPASYPHTDNSSNQTGSTSGGLANNGTAYVEIYR